MSSADLLVVIDAPQMLTRPWISVPSITKKRFAGFSIGLSYVPSAWTVA